MVGRGGQGLDQDPEGRHLCTMHRPLLATECTAGGQLTHLGGSLLGGRAAECQPPVGQPAGGAESLSGRSTSA